LPLHYTLRSGDIVEVLTSKQERWPVAGLAELVRTSRALNKIAHGSSASRRDDAERRHGREQLQQALRNRGLPLAEVAPSDLLADVIAA